MGNTKSQWIPLFLFQSHYQQFNPTLCKPIPLFLVYIYHPMITLLVYTGRESSDRHGLQVGVHWGRGTGWVSSTLIVPVPLVWVGRLPTKLKAGFVFRVWIEINEINCVDHSWSHFPLHPSGPNEHVRMCWKVSNLFIVSSIYVCQPIHHFQIPRHPNSLLPGLPWHQPPTHPQISHWHLPPASPMPHCR